MLKVNGTGTHFWLVEDRLTPLLTWPIEEKKSITLSGKTFNRPETGNQWFDEFVLSCGSARAAGTPPPPDEKEVLHVATVEGKTQIKLNGKDVLHAPAAASVSNPIALLLRWPAHSHANSSRRPGQR